MEFIGAIIGVCIGVCGCLLYQTMQKRNEKETAQDHVYLMRVSANGRVEIKLAPAALWTWKY